MTDLFAVEIVCLLVRKKGGKVYPSFRSEFRDKTEYPDFAMKK